MSDITLHPPIRLISGLTRCHRCDHEFRAVAIAADIEDGEHRQVGLLQYIQTLPDELLALVRERFPHFERVRSATAGLEYMANVCPSCRALAGDHFLHGPGDLFFPMDEAAVAALGDEELFFERPVQVTADYGVTHWL